MRLFRQIVFDATIYGNVEVYTSDEVVDLLATADALTVQAVVDNVVNGALGTLTVRLEGSNDGRHWVDLGILINAGTIRETEPVSHFGFDAGTTPLPRKARLALRALNADSAHVKVTMSARGTPPKAAVQARTSVPGGDSRERSTDTACSGEGCGCVGAAGKKGQAPAAGAAHAPTGAAPLASPRGRANPLVARPAAGAIQRGSTLPGVVLGAPLVPLSGGTNRLCPTPSEQVAACNAKYKSCTASCQGQGQACHDVCIAAHGACFDAIDYEPCGWAAAPSLPAGPPAIIDCISGHAPCINDCLFLYAGNNDYGQLAACASCCDAALLACGTAGFANYAICDYKGCEAGANNLYEEQVLGCLMIPGVAQVACLAKANTLKKQALANCTGLFLNVTCSLHGCGVDFQNGITYCDYRCDDEAKTKCTKTFLEVHDPCLDWCEETVDYGDCLQN